MAKQKIKSHLLIEDKFLCSILYFKDKYDLGCLKLSFKNKIADFVKYTDISSTKPVPLKLDNPINLDISYKFNDNLLEIKKIVNKKIEREFYKMPIPVSTYLFIIKIKNWNLLDFDDKKSNNPLVLKSPGKNKSVAIIFSFVGVNGEPITPKEYACTMGIIDIPKENFNKFCIGIAEDKNNIEINNFIIKIPYQE